MWKTPSRRAFKPEGITRGATVTGLGLSSTAAHYKRITGQVWAQAPSTPRKRWWWVVTADGVAHLCEATELTVLGQCVDTPLAIDSAA